MGEGLRKKAEPFDSFKQVLSVLHFTGFLKLHHPTNRCTKICHEVYRVLAIIIVYTYTLQHTIYSWMVREDYEKLVGAVILQIPEMILCCKVITLYMHTKRIDNLNEVMKDPIFAARNDKDERYIKNNTVVMTKLSRFAICGLSVVGCAYFADPIVQRYQDETTTVPSYMPFKTDTWPKFILANVLDIVPILWVGYGHFNIDCLIATYYSQARLQLKIINYNLEHLFDTHNAGLSTRNSDSFRFLDEADVTVQDRFVHYVNRYEKVLWFTNEVTSIFGSSISMQFFLTSCSTCLVVYQMSSTPVASVAFIFMVGFYLATQFQIFVYCYYGGLVEYESKFVSDSLYLGEWLSLSPRFRRQLLIAMTRWIHPITPRVSSIVPLSLTTFISLSRSAYTLYTVLKSSKNRENGHRSLAF